LAEYAARRPSSSGDRALASSSCGSTPSRRTSAFADSFRMRINQANTIEKIRIGPAVSRAVASGRAIAAFFGTSSPKSIDSSVAMTSASALAMLPWADPNTVSAGAMRWASAGSAR
jgi:predicted neuraminidase